MEIKLKIMDASQYTKAISFRGQAVSLGYMAEYEEGDLICLEASQSGQFCQIQFDDAMLPAIVFLPGNALFFKIPFGEKRTTLSPKAFRGKCHLLSARIVGTDEIFARRNLALNPYDGFAGPQMFPHASANVETRDEAVFAARNAIDGIWANQAHGQFPYGSWGINRRADAEWKLEFGAPVCLDELRITLRGDFPHDNHWCQAIVDFSDGSSETLSLLKSEQPQCYPLKPRIVTSLLLHNLIQSEDSTSPFPALTQFEAWGHYEKTDN